MNLMRTLANFAVVAWLVGATNGCAAAAGKSAASTMERVPELSVEAIKNIGVHESTTGQCIAKISTSGMGGGLDVSIAMQGQDFGKIIAKDVTGLAWLSGTEAVFSVSPIYGKPGIFVYNCRELETRTVVSASRFSSAYPDGADYFELKKILPEARIIFYYHGVNVDEIDFSVFRNQKNEHVAEIKGDGK